MPPPIRRLRLSLLMLALVADGSSPILLGGVLNVLTEHGADINARDKQGRAPLLLAASVSGVVAEYGGGQRVNILQALLDYGADVAVCDNEGQTPLILSAAARQSRTNILALLDRGADVNAQDNRGITALAWAARWGDDEAVKLLRDHGAHIGLPEALLLGG